MMPVAPVESALTDEARDEATKRVSEDVDGGLVLSDDIRKLCPGIEAPTFGYDSASLDRPWAAVLRTLSVCMKSGGLAKERLILTGHADPRGDDDYNIALGGRRADSLRRALATYGVETGRVDTTSRGEVDATGTDEGGWRRDRRVDVDVAGAGHRVSSR